MFFYSVIGCYVSVTAMSYVKPRLSRIPYSSRHRRRFYLRVARSTPGFRPRRVRLSRRSLRETNRTSPHFNPRMAGNAIRSRCSCIGRRPSKSTRSRLRLEARSLVLESLRWREKGFTFCSASVEQFLTSVDPLSHFALLRDFVSLNCSTPTDGSLFPHRQALVAASTNFHGQVLEYGTYKSSIPKTVRPQPELPRLLKKPSKVETPIVLDTGASFSVTPHVSDFITPIQPADLTTLNSLDGKISVHGTGQVEWVIQDQNDVKRIVRTTALFIPSAGVRLFSPQSFFMENEAGSLTCTHDLCVLEVPDGTKLEFPWQPKSNLPIMLTESMLSKRVETSTPAHKVLNLDVGAWKGNQDDYPREPTPSVLLPNNLNLTGSQKELLLWHQRLGHADLQRVQALLSQPRNEKGQQVLFPINRGVTTCDLPKCEACQYAKQKQRVPPSRFQKPNPDNLGGQSEDILEPGRKVSCDFYEVKKRGRLPKTQGKESPDLQYYGGVIFCDVASKFIYIENLTNLTMTFAVKAKHSLERFAETHGVKIREYVADNGFTAKEFTTDIENQRQVLSLSGVGAQHQNRVERSIQTIFNWSRAMLLHFVMHWPQEAKLSLWPYAVSYAVWLWNNMPEASTRLSPQEIFSGVSNDDYRHVQRARVFGCPVYVLEAGLFHGKKVPKWKRRSRRGVFLGFSRGHHSTVALVLNPDTGYVTPQYHVVFDEKFTTVSRDGSEPFDPLEWISLFESGHDRHPNIEPVEDENGQRFIPALPPDVANWPDPEDDTDGDNDAEMTFDPTETEENLLPDTHTSDDPQREDPVMQLREDDSGDTPLREAADGDSSLREPTEASSPLREGPLSSTREPIVRFDSSVKLDNVPRRSDRLRHSKTVVPRRSGRTRTPSNTMTDEAFVRPRRLSLASAYNLSKQVNFSSGNYLPRVRGERLNDQRLSTLQWDDLKRLCLSGTIGAFASQLQRESVDGYVEDWHPALLAVKANSEDLPTWNEAMNGPHAAGFWEACNTELDTLNRKNCWDVVDRPKDRPVVSSTWAFKIKRYPDGSMRKLKARFCARGYEQTEGVDYFETFAPVVEWTTVRFLLIMSLLLGLQTTQVDYVAAFVQSDIDTEVYVEMPRGFSKPGKVLRLNKSLYGLKQSPRNHYQNLKSKLEDLGFSTSDSDPCLFVSDKVIALVYVDDTLLYAKDAADIDAVIKGLQDRDMELQKEEDVAGFLGVHIDRRSDGTIKLTQKGLIKRIVDALNISHLPPKKTPAKLGVLASDPEGDPPDGTFSYPSVLGMMGYLQANSRLDISFAVAQCARFAHKPMRSHEQALERIGQYLKGTMEEGMILDPRSLTSEFTSNVYVDADFAGGWGYEDPNDPACVRSRTGYILEVMGCPIAWKSKLQTDIATSTMESEYSALSMALRAAIPMLDVVKYIVSGFAETNRVVVKFLTTVHEDNQGALRLAQMEPGRNTPRSKFYAIKHHWFRSWLKPKEIELEYIESKKQKADILTKSLPCADFERCRFLSCGW